MSEDSTGKNKLYIDERLLSKLSDIVSNPNQIILTNKELQRKLNVSGKTLQRWRDQGFISYSKIGGTILYKWSDVLQMYEDNRVEPIINNLIYSLSVKDYLIDLIRYYGANIKGFHKKYIAKTADKMMLKNSYLISKEQYYMQHCCI